MGGMDQLNPGGGSAMARGAARSGTMSCTSCFASALGADWSDGGYQNGLQHLRDVGESTDGPKIFQLYIRGDDEEVDAYAAEAIAAGYDAFCITVDVQMPSRRERDIASGGRDHPHEVITDGDLIADVNVTRGLQHSHRSGHVAAPAVDASNEFLPGVAALGEAH